MRTERRHKYLVPSLAVAAVLMFGFGYAMVPLYDMLCKVLGINGKVDDITAVYDPSSVAIDQSREIELRLVAINNEAMPWNMASTVKSLHVHPGQVYQLSYNISNPTPQAMSAQAVPSVSPSTAAQYMKKVQCFCFNSMSLGAGEATEAKVVFYIDPQIPVNINAMILSYTLFDVTDTFAVN